MDVDPKILNRYMTDRVKLPVRLDEDAKAGDILTARMTDEGMLYARREEPDVVSPEKPAKLLFGTGHYGVLFERTESGRVEVFAGDGEGTLTPEEIAVLKAWL